MKAHIRLPKTRLLVVCLLLFSLFFVHQSCTKIDTKSSSSSTNVTEKFFSLPPATLPIVKRVAKKLEEQNSITEFIKDFAKNKGFAFWDKAQVTIKTKKGHENFSSSIIESSDTIIIIPVVLENTNLVNGFLQATLHDSINVQFHRRSSYEVYPFGHTQDSSLTAERYMVQMMLLDKAVFGDTLFKVVDSRLFLHAGFNTIANPADHFISINEISQNNLFENAICVGSWEQYVCVICHLESCQYSHWYYWETCMDGGGGTSSGSDPGQVGNTGNPGQSNGSGGTIPVSNPSSPQNPCDSVNAMAQNTTFRNLFQYLKSQVPTKKENMYILPENDFLTTPTLYPGQEHEFEVWPTPTNEEYYYCRGWIHNHWAHQDSASLIFSSGDIATFARQLTDTATYHIDYKKFMIGVVCDSSAQYMLMVKDIDKFRLWAQFNSDDFVLSTRYTQKKLSTSYLPLSVAETEKRFLQLMSTAGIELYKGSNDFKTWNTLSLATNGNTVISTAPCP
jgi:hypothetical protein